MSLEWLKTLAEYYDHNKPSKVRVKMLILAFGDEEETIMEIAIGAYAQEHEHFPQVAQLKPFVDTARLKANVPHRTPVQMYQIISKQWVICPTCGERTPNIEDCPFCADMRSIQFELAAATES